MTNRLKCPECGNDEFGQYRTVSYGECCVVSFSLRGEVEDERIVSHEFDKKELLEAHYCTWCRWQLLDENGEPITKLDEIVAAFESGQTKIGKPADIPDDPKAHYSLTGEWRGWRDFLGVPDDSPICDECGNHPCECGMDVAAKESSE